ncbi:MAG: Hemerythrin domain-containing protein [Nitrospira sp.]|nr:MAG: Hemerythrin domain-containing protein [Nitrospira sp.]
MAELIQELKEHHTHLLSILQLAKINGVATLETRELLRSARTTLLDHLRKEDVELYPVLRTAAIKDPAIQDMLETFANDMAETSKVAIGFFKKWDQGETDHDLSKEFGLLQAKLVSRIRREEELLYPLYEQIIAKKAA